MPPPTRWRAVIFWWNMRDDTLLAHFFPNDGLAARTGDFSVEINMFKGDAHGKSQDAQLRPVNSSHHASMISTRRLRKGYPDTAEAILRHHTPKMYSQCPTKRHPEPCSLANELPDAPERGAGMCLQTTLGNTDDTIPNLPCPDAVERQEEMMRSGAVDGLVSGWLFCPEESLSLKM